MYNYIMLFFLTICMRLRLKPLHRACFLLFFFFATLSDDDDAQSSGFSFGGRVEGGVWLLENTFDLRLDF